LYGEDVPSEVAEEIRNDRARAEPVDEELAEVIAEALMADYGGEESITRAAAAATGT